MGFTLGNKEAICNDSTKYPLSVDGDEMFIQGFGSFDKGQIVTAGVGGFRFTAGVLGTLAITCPSASDLGIASTDKSVPVVTHIRVNTSRYSSEWAVDFIKRGRPFIFELMLDGSDAAADVATKLDQAFADYEAVFNLADNGLPFTYAVAAAVNTLTLKEDHLSFQSTVEFLPKGETYGTKASTTVTANKEAAVTGKDLEENVRMSLPTTSDAYSIGAGIPQISGSYTTVTWKAKAPIDAKYGVHKGIFADPVDSLSAGQEHTFTLYLLEGSDLFADGGYVETLASFLGTTAGAGYTNFLCSDGVAAATAEGFRADTSGL